MFLCVFRHSFFKSKVKREFIKTQEGPAPGDYDPAFYDTKPFISSSFKAVGNRFKYTNKVNISKCFILKVK